MSARVVFIALLWQLPRRPNLLSSMSQSDTPGGAPLCTTAWSSQLEAAASPATGHQRSASSDAL